MNSLCDVGRSAVLSGCETLARGRRAILRKQAGEFRLLSGTEPVCVQAYHPTECCLQQQAARGSPPRNMMSEDRHGTVAAGGGDRDGQAHDVRDQRTAEVTAREPGTETTGRLVTGRVDGMKWRMFRHPPAPRKRICEGRCGKG